jgi:small subunit ribosomal protein S3
LGHKVHPYGFRLGVIRDWKSHWYAEGEEYANLLHEDLQIRQHIEEKSSRRAGVSRIEIERFPKQVTVTIWTAKPGIVIGRRGSNVKELRDELEQLTGRNLSIDVQEVEQPELDAKLVASNIASQLERRIYHGRAMKRAVDSAMDAGAEGVKVECKGRLSGSQMARREWRHEGQVPLQTLRANVDFAKDEAPTTYGNIGIKVWIYKGEILSEEEAEEQPFVV